MSNGNFWGGSNNSKQYLMEMEHNNPFTKPDYLIGHSFTNFNSETIDRVVANTVRLKRGAIVEEQVVLRQARQTAVTYTVGMGAEGEAYTPLLDKIERSSGGCEQNIYIKRLCNDNDDFAHFYALIDSVFNPPTFVNDLITTDDTTNVVSKQSEARAPEMLTVWNVGAFKIADVTPAIHAIAAKTAQCADCEAGNFTDFYAGGGSAATSEIAYLVKTTDRFSSTTQLTTNIPAENVVTSLYADGDILLAGFSDDPDPTAGAAGGTSFSSDGGTTMTVDSNLTLPVNGVAYFDGQYIAVGGAGGGQAHIWVSDDGVTWTDVASAELPATYELTSISVDPVNECFYVTGAHGTFLKGTKSGTSIQLAAIALPSVSTTYLWRVKVMGDDHVAVGGASGYYAESLDGGDTWNRPGTTASTSAIKGISGKSHIRANVAAGTRLGDRTILSDNTFKLKTLQLGASISGNYTDMTNGDDEHDYAIAVTDAGEVVLLKPFKPNA